MSLSRTSVVNVRDAVTEAVMTCCVRLLHGRVQLKYRMDTTERQLNAEKQRVKRESKGTRHQAIEKQYERTQNVCN